MKQRSHAFDLLCGLCIIRMVTLHITTACGFAATDWWKSVMGWTYFFMCFFFFKAGYFNKSVSGNTREYLEDKTKRLLVPYFSWGVISNIVLFFYVWFVLPSGNPNVKCISWEHVWENGGFFGNGPLWFLFSFYMSYVIVHIISKIPDFPALRAKDHTIHIRVIWVIILFPYISYWLYTRENPLPMNMSNVFLGVFLFELGRVWRMCIDNTNRGVMLVVSLLLMGVFVFLNISYGGLYEMNSNTWTGDFFVLLAAIVCVSCGLSGVLLSLRIPRIPVIGYIGEHSMVYFVSHQIIINFYKLTKSASVHTLRNHWDDYAILLVICFVICTLLVPHVEKIPWLSGRFKKKEGKLWII
ncbi:MAG: acyltransferase [Bacteroidaceae bacterium]|nr:acyltransferase [Bacteroidaceae bacterium]